MCKLVHKYLRALFVVKFVEIIAKPAAAVIAILKICSTIASPNQRPIDAGGFKGRSIIWFAYNNIRMGRKRNSI